MGGSLKIVYILNDSYWYPVLVSAKSALMCVAEEGECRIEFIMIVDAVSEVHKRLIDAELSSPISVVRYKTLDMSLFEKFTEYHGSKLVWTRCKINSILPDIDDWICVCDGDTLWIKSPEEVFKFADQLPSDTIICGSRNNVRKGRLVGHLIEKGIRLPEETYFCMGFALLNLGRIKAVSGEQKMEEFLARYGMTQMNEQDIFNVVFYKNIELMHRGWGISPRCLSEVSFEDIGLIHYFGGLPWPSSYLSRMSDAESLWWRFAGKYVKACPDDARFKMNPLLYLVMRFWNLLIRIFPSGVISGHDRDARLPVRQLLKKMGNVEA